VLARLRWMAHRRSEEGLQARYAAAEAEQRSTFTELLQVLCLCCAWSWY